MLLARWHTAAPGQERDLDSTIFGKPVHAAMSSRSGFKLFPFRAQSHLATSESAPLSARPHLHDDGVPRRSVQVIQRNSERSRHIAAKSKTAPASEEEMREAHMAVVDAALAAHADQICTSLEDRGYAIIDDFLPAQTIAVMRSEAEGLLQAGELVVSQSTRWDPEQGKVVSYAKHNVMATTLTGGEKYVLAPRLTEYVVSLVSALPSKLNAHFSGISLSNRAATNKLAVCMGEESSYDKHIDNMGGDDMRKLTALLYLQEHWQPDMGGCFRMFPPTADESIDKCEDIPPIGGRLLVFWSDTRVHSVCPSFAPDGAEQHRWALTVWLHTLDPSVVQQDEALEALHFPDQQHGQG
eukprot:gnl/TRDRNA2_/TRDRNA2_139524_c0_seq2.p1 gnl/TRDRNA2_/TRDRNA2_139524_c0~~gnl/TRDRNA2_/TRDRNA2_139524_c0_seq2.p1  ORF type:complete len:366 (-),score=68.63 gnl/TRDRNA2_/TRDRNA2_139524_c0_seq2:232-1293(-)